MNTYTEIPVTQIEQVRIGQVENPQAGTGCTVFVCPEGMRAGVDVRGGGPASRETQLLNPLMSAQVIHAITLGGGSAFGLGAATGVMNYLEAHRIGLEVGVTRVPLVAQSDIFDLTVGDPHVRPDEGMGYCGMETCMKSGIGSFALQSGQLKIGAVVVVNALGDVYDWKNGRQIAGLLTEDRKALRSTEEYMKGSLKVVENRFTGNTTLAVVMTNAYFSKSQLCKIAGLAHDGYARSIRPVHTSADGDSIYAVSVGDVQADQDVIGILAAEVISEAITRAVSSAEGAYGYPALRDL